jgi:DNA recombination protein RmuC
MTQLLIIFACLICAAVGALAGYLLAERRSRAAASQSQTSLALAQQRQQDVSAQLAAEQAAAAELGVRLSTSEKTTATVTAQLASSQENLAQQRALLDQARQQLRDAFASLSAEALAKNNHAFLQLARETFATVSAEATGSLDQRKAQIEALLTPMRELLNQYQSRLGDIEKSRVESYSMLREQLGVLSETQRTLNVQTGNLVTALRRPSTRGQWGEISLRKLVELAGMSGKCDFSEQTSVDGEEGKLRPDMVVHLPGGREIVIDCKAPLDAFLDAAAVEDEDLRRVHLARHSQQVRTRARELGMKNYWLQFKRSPEYVVMFLPGEAFLYAAVEQDGTLIEDCMKNRVIVATPTTLIALLKAIEFGWRQEAITENAEQIRVLGKELYDRIAVLAAHFQKVGQNLASTIDSYNSAVASMETRVLVTARKISEMGAKSEKELPDVAPVDSRPRELSAANPAAAGVPDAAR